MDKYDYIITGAGAAGLSLLIHMIQSGTTSGKQILLVDRAPKIRNDRTWCFWEKDAGMFEPVICRRWSELWFHAKGVSTLHDISPYEYKLIRSIDFYDYCFSIIQANTNVTVQYGDVSACISDGAATYVVLDGKRIDALFIFNSILFQQPAGRHQLLQHFKGWLVESDKPVFDGRRATLMDFRVKQNSGNTTFVYVMPFSDTRALVEYTVFGEALLKDHEYDEQLAAYCTEFCGLRDYIVTENEFGVIPMTDHIFKKRHNNIVHIGTAGGQTKASSGYTFHFIQKHSRAIVQALKETGKPFIRSPLSSRRFSMYDKTLLHILATHAMPGQDVFALMMSTNRMKDVMKFLDNETSFLEELKIIRALPKARFLRAAVLS